VCVLLGAPDQTEVVPIAHCLGHWIARRRGRWHRENDCCVRLGGGAAVVCGAGDIELHHGVSCADLTSCGFRATDRTTRECRGQARTSRRLMMEEGALGAPVATGAAGELVVQSRLLARGWPRHYLPWWLGGDHRPYANQAVAACRVARRQRDNRAMV